MGYAIVGYFDETVDEKIKNLWAGMAEAGVDDYLIQSENNPHIKFAMYEDLDLEQAKTELKKLTVDTQAIPVQFKSYSFYPNEKPFVNIDLAVSIPILNLQRKIRNVCDKHAQLFGFNFFDQGIWKPDCQLTIEFEKEKLLDAVKYLSNTKLPLNGMLSRIGIIEFHPAKQLVDYKLNR